MEDQVAPPISQADESPAQPEQESQDYSQVAPPISGVGREERVANFLSERARMTNAHADEESRQSHREETGRILEQRFPGTSWESQQGRYDRQQRLWNARYADEAEGDTTGQRVARAVGSVLPFGWITGMRDRAQYTNALHRLQAGTPQESDYSVIAEYERHNREAADASSTTGGKLGQIALHLPGQLMELRAGGEAAGQLIGGSTTALARGARFGTQLALTPAMYAQSWQQNNLEAGRDSLDWHGLPTALAHGAITQAIFGQMGSINQRATAMAGGGILGRLAGTGAAAATGVIEDQAIATVGRWAGLSTGYGTIHDLITGEPGAVGDILGQALTFAAFAQMHGGEHPERPVETVVRELRHGARNGESSTEAARRILPAIDAINMAMKNDPNLTREQARTIADGLSEGPAREAARVFADSLPEATRTPAQAQPSPPEAPAGPQTAPTPPEAQTPVQPPQNAALTPGGPPVAAPAAPKLSFDDVKGVARSLGISVKGSQAEITARIVQSGGGGFLDRLIKPPEASTAAAPPEQDVSHLAELTRQMRGVGMPDNVQMGVLDHHMQLEHLFPKLGVGKEFSEVVTEAIKTGQIHSLNEIMASSRFQGEINREASELSQRTGVSAASVRSSLRRLLQEGFAFPQALAPNQGRNASQGAEPPARPAEVARGSAQTSGEPGPPAPADRGPASGNQLTPEQQAWHSLAQEEGLNPDRLHHDAAQILANDAPLKEAANGLRNAIFSAHPELKTVQMRNAKGKIDIDSIRGLDDIAEKMIPPEFEHLFPRGVDREQRLFDLLTGGRQKPMTEEAAYHEAMSNQMGEQTRREMNSDIQEEARRGAVHGEAEDAVHQGIQDANRQAQEAAEEGGGHGLEHGHPPGADVGEFNPGAGFGQPLTEAERRTGSIGGGQSNAGEGGGGRQPRVTALANEQVDRERAARGQPPLMQAARQSNPETWDRAMATLDRDPQAASRLVEELTKKPRATTVEENALLLHRKIALANEHERAMRQVIEDGKPGSTADAITMRANEAREDALREQVKGIDKVTHETGTEWGRAGQFRRQLAAEDYSLSGMLMRAEVAKGRPLSQEEKSQILQLQARITELQGRLDASEARLAKSGTGAKGPEFPEMQHDRATLEEAKGEFNRQLNADRQANQPLGRRLEDLWLKIRRAFVISSPKTMGKIIAASAERLAITPMDEAAGAVWSRLPGIAKIAEMAPREGRGLSPTAERAALLDGFGKGMTDAWQTLKTGHSELDALYGRTDMPRSWLDMVGELHAAGKAPAVRAEYTRSLLQRIDQATAKGEDVTSPAALQRIGLEAYKDSQRAKFQQDNRVVTAWKNAMQTLRAKDASFGSRALGLAGETLLPVVRIPTNLVAETFQYAFGTVTGLTRAGVAHWSGIENLKPEQADLIMRSLKKGSLGLAALGVGFFNPQIFGGFYSGRRDERDVTAGGIRVGGANIPSWLLHNPFLEVFQMGAAARRAFSPVTRARETDPVTAFGSSIMGLAEEAPMIRQTTEIAKGLSPTRRGQFFGELAKSLAVPQFFQWLAGRTDTKTGNPVTGETVRRSPSSIMQHVETGIPGLRQNVPLAR